MMIDLFGRSRAQANRRTILALHADIVAAVRQPVFYDGYGVADTFEGRFEMLTLLAVLVLRRLNRAQPPGPEVAQKLVDTLFAHLDPALRELGVGDLAVPKRMKRLAEAFLGRSAAYDAALREGEEALAAALTRNVLDGAGSDGERPDSETRDSGTRDDSEKRDSGKHDDGRRLARYARAAAEVLDGLSVEDLLRGPLRFPDPAGVR